MSKFISFFKSNDFVRHNLIFFIGSMLVAGLNYIYYPIISRLVSVVEYGEIQAIIAVFMQVGILLTAFGYTVTFAVNNESTKGGSNKVILELEKITLVASLILFLVLCIAGLFFKDNLQFESSLPLILVGILVLINIPSTSRTYILQGIKKLKEVSLSGIIFALSKLIISVIFILLGFSVTGVVVAYIIAQILTLIYLDLKTHSIFPTFFSKMHLSLKPKSSDKRIISNEWKYGLFIAAMLFSAAVLYSFDVVIVRAFVTPESAGLYSGISTIAKIVYFITVSVSGVLLATVRLKDSDKVANRNLRKSATIIFIVGGFLTALLFCFPSFFVTILIGQAYLPMANILPALAILMLVCSFNNLLICFHIARKNVLSIISVIVALLTLGGLLMFVSGDIINFVKAFTLANVAMAVILTIIIFVKVKHND